MPEIPELEAFKYVVKTHCLHKKIKNVESSNKKLIKISFPKFKKELVGHPFDATERKGKYLLIYTSDRILVMHFALTGFLVYAKNPDEKVRFTSVKFIFSDDSVLHWISIRQFEKIWLVKNIDEIKGLSTLGVDALKISKKEFLELAQKYSTKNVKAFLMDQTILAGIGNEYSDEILFQSSIDPHHKIKDLSKSACAKMYTQMKKILKYAITLRIKDIKKMPEQNFLSNKDRETFKSSYLQAHRHTDMMCPKNKNHRLKKVTIAGRSTYYCPIDQK